MRRGATTIIIMLLGVTFGASAERDLAEGANTDAEIFEAASGSEIQLAAVDEESVEEEGSASGDAEAEEEDQPGLFRRMGSALGRLLPGDDADGDEESRESISGDQDEATASDDSMPAEQDEEEVASDDSMSAEQDEVEVASEETMAADDEADEDKGAWKTVTSSVGSSVGKVGSSLGKVGSSVGKLWPLGGSEEPLPDHYDLGNRTLGEDADRFVTARQGEQDPVVSLLESSLDLQEFLRLVALKNDRIAYQRMEWAIAKSGTHGARSLYEPALTASYRYTDSDTPNTTEEEFRRSFAPEFIEENQDYTLGLEGTVPFGGKVKVSYTYRQLDNNLQPEPIRGEEDKTYFGVSITQPLLKGGGGNAVVEAPITVAEKEERIAMHTFRQAMFQTISDAARAYWDYLLADKKVESRQRSVEVAESVLKDERERLRFGQGSETDVMSAESAVAQRRVQLYGAQQARVQARNELRGFLADLPDEHELVIDTDRPMERELPQPDRSVTLENAFDHRPEYLASLIRAEKEDVRIKFARNNRLPQLDLVASYGLNGLDTSFSDSYSDAFDRDHETMYVGLEYKMFLGGDRKAKSELTAAQLRKHQALLEVRAAEVAIHNSVDTAISNVETALRQVRELDDIADTNKRLMDVELQRFEAGQSDSRELFQLEERLNETMETYLESQANLQKAAIGLKLAEGTLLQQFGLER